MIIVFKTKLKIVKNYYFYFSQAFALTSCFSNNLPDSMFGIKINDNAGNYVDIKKGIELKDRPGFLNFLKLKVLNLTDW